VVEAKKKNITPQTSNLKIVRIVSFPPRI